jgi:hypothetical protein
MEKTLLIVTAFMALGLLVQAKQIQASQADQLKLSRQAEPIQTETNFVCFSVGGKVYCQ